MSFASFTHLLGNGMYHCCVTCPAIPVIQPTNEMNLLKCIEGLAFTNGILCSNSRQASGACPCAKGRAGGNVLSYKLCKRGYGLTMDPRLYFCCGRGCRSLAMNHGLMQTENSRILSCLIGMPSAYALAVGLVGLEAINRTNLSSHVRFHERHNSFAVTLLCLASSL